MKKLDIYSFRPASRSREEKAQNNDTQSLWILEAWGNSSSGKVLPT